MVRKVAVAGGRGELGRLIVNALSSLGVEVVVLGRQRASSDSAQPSYVLRGVNYDDVDDLAKALADVDVVVSTLAGLSPVILEAQGRLMEAAAMANVRKFMPSDFSIDFRPIAYGQNRNLNLRREFFERFEEMPIRKTSILNGAFTDMLTGRAPFILFGLRRILCWGDPAQKMDWTTMADTARYTAHAALDEESPRFLKIAGDELSALDMSALMADLTGIKHPVLKPAGLRTFGRLIGITRFFVPGGQDIYPPWQGMQYMHNMYSGIPKFDALDNQRYPMDFKSARDVLSEFLQQKGAA